ncbi:MAG TPA: histidine--tRNA ligase, partial [Anaeromyxobacteraceae bacterium]|nr:histidine--tRNA ligase [Anaeromyxobacteraceae bacterium]
KQKGRWRQFYQIGAEVLGSDSAAIEVETIEMVLLLLEILEVKVQLLVNSVGCSRCRPQYVELLRTELQRVAEHLCEDCRRRSVTNPLRVLDCKVESCQPVLRGAPQLLDRLCPECRAHFDAVQAALEQLGVAFTLDPRLVRGLDYYVRTAYEFTSDVLGSQSAVAGGGRYDGLVELLGGPAVPGIGFALGQERLAMMMEAVGRASPVPRPEVFLVAADEAGGRAALSLAASLRKAGVACDLDHRSGKLKAQQRHAERVGARYALVLGGNEVASGQAKLKDMASREETPVALADLAARLGGRR